MMKNVISIILAAGKSKRMNSFIPKVLYKLNEKTIIEYCLECAESLGLRDIIVVVGYKKEMVKKVLGNRVKYVIQKKQLGTGHAVLQTARLLKNFHGFVFVTNGDHPFIKPRMFFDLYNICVKSRAAASILTVRIRKNPPAWGRILRDEHGFVRKIIEASDASRKILSINELNTGVYCFKSPLLFQILQKVKNNNAQKEYYLTDVFKIMIDKGLKVVTVETDDFESVIGINTPEEFEAAKVIAKKNIINN